MKGFRQVRQRGLLLGVLLVVMAAVVIGGASTAVGNNPPFPVNSHLLQVFQTRTLPASDGTVPAVVAQVDGVDISSDAYARELAIIRNNDQARTQHLTDQQMKIAAINALIQDQALYSRAVAEGITVTDAEVLAFIQNQQSILAQSEISNPSVTADANAAMTANGDMSRVDYWNDPKVIAHYRRMLIKGKLLEAHLGRGASIQTLDSFVAQTVGSAHVHVYVAT